MQDSNEKNYTVIVDEICAVHGGRNFVYQYDDENFVRVESVCEGCQNVSHHVVSPQLQETRGARQPQTRPHRPAR